MKNRFPGNLPVHQLWQKLGILAFLGLAVHLLLPQITSLEHSWHVLESLTPWAVGLAFFAQILSYAGAGYLMQVLVNVTHLQIGLLRSTMIVMGSASVGLVVGGFVGSSAAVFRWISRGRSHQASATLAVSLPSLLNSLVLVVISIFGLAHLLLLHDLSMVELAGFSAIILLLGLLVVLATLALKYRDRAKVVGVRVARHIAQFRRKPFDPSLTRKTADDLFAAWDLLRHGAWQKPVLGAVLSVVFDMLTLLFLFVATGHDVGPGVLLAGYGLPMLLGKMAFVVPGGVGVVEGSMVALFAGLGVLKPVAVVVVLGYRLISFWLPSFLGFPIAGCLQRSMRAGKKADPSA
jgi:glycosyltransferase 2 family protein